MSRLDPQAGSSVCAAAGAQVTERARSRAAAASIECGYLEQQRIGHTETQKDDMPVMQTSICQGQLQPQQHHQAHRIVTEKRPPKTMLHGSAPGKSATRFNGHARIFLRRAQEICQVFGSIRPQTDGVYQSGTRKLNDGTGSKVCDE